LLQGPHIKPAILLTSEEKFNADLVHSYATVWDGNNSFLQRYTLNFGDHWGYMPHCQGISKHDIEEFIVPDDVEEEDRICLHFAVFASPPQ
jgi:hypothetical protein